MTRISLFLQKMPGKLAAKRLSGDSKSVPKKGPKTTVKVKKSGIVDKENKLVKKDKSAKPLLNNNPVTSKRDIIKTKTKTQVLKVLNGSLAPKRTGKIYVGYPASSAGGRS